MLMTVKRLDMHRMGVLTAGLVNAYLLRDVRSLKSAARVFGARHESINVGDVLLLKECFHD